MVASLPPIRSWLYAPGNNARLLGKVFQAGADAVILDLEDAVPPAEPVRAREMTAEAVRARAGRSEPATFVRINHPSSGLAEAEIEAVVRPGLTGLRVPKVEDAATVRQVNAWLSRAEQRAGLEQGSVALVCNVETGLGVWRADEIARASSRMVALGFGVADLTRDLGLIPGPDDRETLYLRSHLVLASRVAGVRPPVDGVYVHLQDQAGLERTTRAGKALGFFGRSAIHPNQVPTINAIYTPDAEEVAWARSVVEASDRAESAGSGATRTAGGEFVDVAIVRRARDVLRLADALGAGEREGGTTT